MVAKHIPRIAGDINPTETMVLKTINSNFQDRMVHLVLRLE